jgi:hypothetical protein
MQILFSKVWLIYFVACLLVQILESTFQEAETATNQSKS